MERGVGEDGCVAAALLGSGARSDKNELFDAMESQHDYRTVQHVGQLRRIARPPKQTKHDDDALLISILAGFRIALHEEGQGIK
jgi:ATP-dependent helicase HrpB